MRQNDLFPIPVDLETVDDDRLNILMEWAEELRTASELAGYTDYVQICDERIMAIQYEMTGRMCNTEEYSDWMRQNA